MLLSCDVCLCLCCLLSQVVAVSGPFRPVFSSAPVVSGGAVAEERSPPVCEGELCGASSPSVRLGWNRLCLSSLILLPFHQQSSMLSAKATVAVCNEFPSDYTGLTSRSTVVF